MLWVARLLVLLFSFFLTGTPTLASDKKTTQSELQNKQEELAKRQREFEKAKERELKQRQAELAEAQRRLERTKEKEARDKATAERRASDEKERQARAKEEEARDRESKATTERRANDNRVRQTPTSKNEVKPQSTRNTDSSNKDRQAELKQKQQQLADTQKELERVQQQDAKKAAVEKQSNRYTANQAQTDNVEGGAQSPKPAAPSSKDRQAELKQKQQQLADTQKELERVQRRDARQLGNTWVRSNDDMARQPPTTWARSNDHMERKPPTNKNEDRAHSTRNSDPSNNDKQAELRQKQQQLADTQKELERIQQQDAKKAAVEKQSNRYRGNQAPTGNVDVESKSAKSVAPSSTVNQAEIQEKQKKLADLQRQLTWVRRAELQQKRSELDLLQKELARVKQAETQNGTVQKDNKAGKRNQGAVPSAPSQNAVRPLPSLSPQPGRYSDKLTASEALLSPEARLWAASLTRYQRNDLSKYSGEQLVDIQNSGQFEALKKKIALGNTQSVPASSLADGTTLGKGPNTSGVAPSAATAHSTPSSAVESTRQERLAKLSLEQLARLPSEQRAELPKVRKDSLDRYMQATSDFTHSKWTSRDYAASFGTALKDGYLGVGKGVSQSFYGTGQSIDHLIREPKTVLNDVLQGMEAIKNDPVRVGTAAAEAARESFRDLTDAIKRGDSREAGRISGKFFGDVTQSIAAEATIAKLGGTAKDIASAMHSQRGISIAKLPTFQNLLPGRLDFELSEATRAGVNPMSVRIGDPQFERLVNNGTIKFVVLENGELLIAPFAVETARGMVEISHAVLSNGRPVLAAGQADISSWGGRTSGATITPDSGHYKPTEDSLVIARAAFRNFGIEFKK